MIKRSARFLVPLFSILFIALACNLPFLQDKAAQSSQDLQMVKAPVTALAIDLEGNSPAIYLFVGHSTDDPWILPQGSYYLEAAGEHQLVYRIGKIRISDGGGDVELGKRLAAAQAITSQEHNQELILIANAVAGIEGGVLSFLYGSSNGFTRPLFDPQNQWTPAAIQTMRGCYDPVLDREEETTKAIIALDMRAAKATAGKSCPGMCRQKRGILDKFLSFFSAMNGVDQRAVEDVVQGSAAMSAGEKADAFQYFPPSLTGGAQSFDEMVQKMQNGELDKYAPTRIRNYLLDEPAFVEALTETRKGNRPLLEIAHEEGATLVEKGAELQAEIIKQVLQAAFPGIEAGFEYADKVNEWAQFVHTMYTDPTKGAVEFATGQATSQIGGQIKDGLLEMGYGEELAAEMAEYLSNEIVGQIVKHDPELEALALEMEMTKTPEGDEDDADDAESEESDTPGLRACIIDGNLYTWGYENVGRHDCIDAGRCTGCTGQFVVRNTSGHDAYLILYEAFSTGSKGMSWEKWKPKTALKAGAHFEMRVDQTNYWKTGNTTYSKALRILLTKNDPECNLLYAEHESEAFWEAYAAEVEPLSCQ